MESYSFSVRGLLLLPVHFGGSVFRRGSLSGNTELFVNTDTSSDDPDLSIITHKHFLDKSHKVSRWWW